MTATRRFQTVAPLLGVEIDERASDVQTAENAEIRWGLNGRSGHVAGTGMNFVIYTC